ncbi:MAG: hypothetical protein WC241_00615 [Candidatus Paceibacterota bacterium]|jgi:hypothetical protein
MTEKLSFTNESIPAVTPDTQIDTPESKKLLEIEKQLKGMLKGNEENPKITKLLEYAEAAGIIIE